MSEKRLWQLPRISNWVRKLDIFQRAISYSTRKKIQRWFKEGDWFYYHGMEDQAVFCYQWIVNADPNNARAWKMYGLCCLTGLGGERTALSALKTAVELDPHDEEAQAALSRLQSELATSPHVVDKGERAFYEILREFLNQIEGEKDSANQKGADSESNDFSVTEHEDVKNNQSADITTSSLSEKRSKVENLLEQALKEREANRFDQAIAILDKGIDIATKGDMSRLLSTLYSYRADLLSLIGFVEEARETLEWAAELSANAGDYIDESAAYINIGALYLSTGSYDEAYDLFLKALRHLQAAGNYADDRKSLEILTVINLATCERRRGNIVEAHRLIMQCKDPRIFSKFPLVAFRWFSENAQIISWPIEQFSTEQIVSRSSSSNLLNDTLSKAKISFLTAVNLVNEEERFLRQSNAEIFKKALHLAYVTNDPLFGIAISHTFRYGSISDRELGSSIMGKVLQNVNEKLKIENKGLIGLHVDHLNLFLFLIAPNVQYVFAARDFGVEKLDEIVVDNWYLPSQSFRNNPNIDTLSTFKSAISRTMILLGDLLSSLKQRDELSFGEVFERLSVNHIYFLPHRHFSIFPISILDLTSQSSTHSLPNHRKVSNIRGLTPLLVSQGRSWKCFERILVLTDDSEQLPGSEIEYKAIQAGPWECTRLQTNAISKSELMDIIPSYDAIHLGCHAEVQSSRDMFPSITLKNSLLTVEDIESMDCRNLKIVTAGACDTALALLSPLDAHLGFTDIFLKKGCHYACGCLWPVEDLSSSILFTEYYARLATGSTPIDAIHFAQISLRRISISEIIVWLRDTGQLAHDIKDLNMDSLSIKRELERLGLSGDLCNNPAHKPFEHPYYWAPYVLVSSE